MNKTITVTYTDTEELLKFFAKSKGWVEEINELNEQTEEVEVISNPESYTEFITKWATEMLKKEIGEPAKQEIARVFREQERAEQERIAKELEAKLQVTVE